jgi:heme-degrading monooxygenase HmoA
MEIRKMHVILWEFAVQPDRVRDFVAAYQPEGDWAQLFRLADGYLSTELLTSADNAARFVTIDRWTSAEDYTRFHERFGQQYRSLNTQLEGLTRRETHLGTFTTSG